MYRITKENWFVFKMRFCLVLGMFEGAMAYVTGDVFPGHCDYVPQVDGALLTLVSLCCGHGVDSLSDLFPKLWEMTTMAEVFRFLDGKLVTSDGHRCQFLHES